MTNEQKFYNALKAIFIGAKVEGESGKREPFLKGLRCLSVTHLYLMFWWDTFI